MADQTVFRMSNDSSLEDSPFLKKITGFITDSNNSSYSGNMVTFETTSLSSSGSWLDFRNSFLLIPLVIAYKSSVNISAATKNNALVLGLKNSFYTLVDNITCQFNNEQVISQTPYSNLFNNFKILASYSQDYLYKWGPSINFFPDDMNYSYSDVASANGIYICNNVVADVAANHDYSANIYATHNINYGYLERLLNSSIATTAFVSGTAINNGLNAIFNSPATVGKNYYLVDTAVAGAGQIYSTAILCKLYLRDLHSFFQNCPLVKGAQLRLVLQLNMCSSMSIVCTGAAGAAKTMTYEAGGITLSLRTNPLMISSALVNNPSYGAAEVGTITAMCGVSKVSLAPNTTSVITSCRWYIDQYSYSPSWELDYIKLNAQKEIIYDDVFQFTIPTIAAGSSFNNVISNNMIAPQFVVVIPIINKASLGGVTLYSPLESPFTCEGGGNSSPYCKISNFNVAVSSINMFQSDYVYDFQTFCGETADAFTINGAKFLSTSGLINERTFGIGHCFYCCNISRRVGDDTVSKSISVMGKNVSNFTVDYYVFVTHRKRIKIDIVTSQVLETRLG